MRRPIALCGLLALLLSYGCNSKSVSDQPEQMENQTALSASRLQAFVGTYTRNEGHVDGRAKGIYQIAADTAGGKLYRINTIPDIVNPSFVRFSPDGKFLYAVSEVAGGADTTGYVYAYAVNGMEVKFLNRQPSYGQAPCHLAAHPAGNLLFVANYLGGIAVYPLQADGSIGAATDRLTFSGSGPHPRQSSSHPHSVAIDPEGRFAYVADLGTDKIHIFLIDPEQGKLEPAASPAAGLAPGAGPRHLAFHPNGQLLYAINELNSTITVFRYDRADGHLEPLQTVNTLPMDYSGENTCADIHLEPSGRFLYGSNRGHNSIAMFEIDPASGFLNPIGHEPTGGEIPRNFAIDPHGKFLYVANQNSNNIVYFRIDPAGGRLQRIDEIQIPTPVCIEFAPVKRPS